MIKYRLATLRIHQDHYDDELQPSEEDIAQRLRGKQTYFKAMTFPRTGLVFGLLV